MKLKLHHFLSLQIDPSIGQKLGFGGVILHGLCFYGIVRMHSWMRAWTKKLS